MKKVNVLVFTLAILFLSACGGAGGGSEEEQTAARFCKCASSLTEDMAKLKEDPTSVDQEAYMKKVEDMQKCIDPDGKLKEKEDAMTDEERKANDEKMTTLIKEKCPETAEAFGMN